MLPLFEYYKCIDVSKQDSICRKFLFSFTSKRETAPTCHSILRNNRNFPLQKYFCYSQNDKKIGTEEKRKWSEKLGKLQSRSEERRERESERNTELELEKMIEKNDFLIILMMKIFIDFRNGTCMCYVYGIERSNAFIFKFLKNCWCDMRCSVRYMFIETCFPLQLAFRFRFHFVDCRWIQRASKCRESMHLCSLILKWLQRAFTWIIFCFIWIQQKKNIGVEEGKSRWWIK